jgi:curved DNA-binding protein CbpA
MFVDYYAILNINFNATQGAIKSAYKTQALKWHPDRNLEFDTIHRMQQINEAYLILKDEEARRRYDQEYQRYKKQQQQSQNYKEQQRQKPREQEKEGSARNTKQEQRETFEDNTYEVFDETLNNWMSNARKQAVNLTKQTIEDIIGMSKVGGQAMGEAALKGIVKYFIFGIIMLIFIKACQH